MKYKYNMYRNRWLLIAGITLLSYIVLMLDNWITRDNSGAERNRHLMLYLSIILLPAFGLFVGMAWSVHLKCEISEDGIMISGKGNAEIRLPWSSYMICRPQYTRGTKLMLLAKSPNAKIGKTTAGVQEADMAWNPTKYMLEKQIAKYARGRISEEELRNTDVFLIEVGKKRYQQIETWWEASQKA